MTLKPSASIFVILRLHLQSILNQGHFRRALTFFRGEKYKFLREEIEEMENKHSDKGPSKRIIDIMGSEAFLKPLSAALITVVFRLSGFTVLSHYTATYLDDAGTDLDPLLGAIIIGAVRWLGSLSTIVVLYVAPKKTAFTAFGLISMLSWISGR